MSDLQKVDEKNITDGVLNRVIEMEKSAAIDIPKNYSVGNALKSAWLILQEVKTKEGHPALSVCTKESIYNALLDMVVQGLNPVKNQCYFIPYGDKLTLSRSYLGTVAITKRLEGVKDVKGFAVYKDDVFQLGFDITTGKQTIKNYEPKAESWTNKNLIGACAIVIGKEEVLHVEYMTMEQIRSAWGQGKAKGNSPAHTKFPDQMAIKTVINRACKMYANTSDDSNLLTDYINQSVKETDEFFEEEKTAFANQELLEIDGQIVDTQSGEILEDPNPVKAPF